METNDRQRELQHTAASRRPQMTQPRNHPSANGMHREGNAAAIARTFRTGPVAGSRLPAKNGKLATDIEDEDPNQGFEAPAAQENANHPGPDDSHTGDRSARAE